jgi:hypothetical protein
MVQTMPTLAGRQDLPAVELLRNGRVSGDAGRRLLEEIIARLADARERGINPDSVVGACYLGRELQTPLHDGRNRDVESIMDGVSRELMLPTLDPVPRVLLL